MDKTGMTPMMVQYLEIKEQHPECLLFFRLGDFYEMFFDDAKVASKELELVLTGKDCGLPERAPMCGVPFHSCEGYIARLVSRGYKVAICEQTEDPATAKGLVKRDVIRVVTPGTVLESSMLDEGKNNYLCAAFGKGETVGLCFADVSTGDVRVTELSGEDVNGRLCSELGRFSPSEILCNLELAKNEIFMGFSAERLMVSPEVRDDACFNANDSRIAECFGAADALKEREVAKAAVGCLLAYLFETQMTGLERLRELSYYTDGQFMRLDISTRRNLELVETLRGKEKRGSLLGVLDKTKTAMGKRLLRVWLERPLLQPAAIDERLDAVEELVKDSVLCGDLGEMLSGIYDLERIMTRIVYGSANARELRSLSQTIRAAAPVRERLSGAKSAMLCAVRDEMDPLADVCEWIESAIEDEPPLTVREGKMIRLGYNAEVDELRYEMEHGGEHIAQVEQAERERTGIPKLKVGYNRVFGYYIDVPRSFAGEVPPEYIRKQTTTSSERYITEELKRLESRVLGARERLDALEYKLFDELRRRIAAELPRVQKTAQAIAKIDVLRSFAAVSVKARYVRPTMTDNGVLDIRGGRHPVVESLQSAPFVPNDAHLDKAGEQTLLITGPNMAGKSTYMRQVALIVLMAQIGCFVPADRAEIGVVDSIFTRVGASDDLASGQSTFMVEMSEVASILKHATRESLIIFDEIGRGTSTFDGMSIAQAVLEYVTSKKIGAKTLFATHYHELTALEGTLPGVVNYSVAVKKRGEDITFLRRIIRGPADQSYGIEVAKLAGVPNDVVKRARVILDELDAGERPELPPRRASEDDGQLSLLDAMGSPVLEKLKRLDVNTLTPIEAMQTLYELQKEANE